MKKRLLSISLTLIMLMGMLLFMSASDVKASEDATILDGSCLTHDMESVGYATKITRGADLFTGYSKCVVQGPGKIYVGGTTIAAHVVDSVRIAVIVERAKDGDTTWEYYDSWEKENANTDRAASSRALTVEGGYYYRVRCFHGANKDVSSSFTNGVFVEKP